MVSTHQQGSVPNYLLNFKPKIILNIDLNDYCIQTALNYQDVIKALHLRYMSFFGSQSLVSINSQLDIDEYDKNADHLIIFKKNDHTAIGTYRILNSETTPFFYSENEFNMESVKVLKGIKLEVGRACIHPEYRNSTILSSLWTGISEYIRQTNAQYIFGCSSIPINSTAPLNQFHHILIQKYLSSPNERVIPKKKFPLKHVNMDEKNSQKFERILPPLLKGYLKMGGKICGEPAWDSELKTLDYFTLVKRSELHPSFSKKYNL